MFRALSFAHRIIPTVFSFRNEINTKLSSLKCSNSIFQARSIQTNRSLFGLMEFFDDKKNWGAQEIKVGRAWNVEELRIKSNVDLHKLWYILLKERNMLMTMEHECKDNAKSFPNPERIDKVEISMKNVETVLRERNKAYHLLETGDDGERHAHRIKNQLGMYQYVKYQEHLLPRFMRKTKLRRETSASKKFILKYREQVRIKYRRERNRNRNHVLMLFKRFPNIDKDELKRRYPELNIDALATKRKADGHFENTN